MDIMAGFRWLIGREESTQDRSLEDLVVATTGAAAVSRPWRNASTREAMGVPAVFRAVSLISNTTGLLSLEAYRLGAKLDALSTPRIVMRPNPFTTPRVFFRDTSYHMIRRGEAWWWTAARDADGLAMSLIPVDPREVTVSQNPKDLRFPIIEWRGRRMPNRDMTQLTLLPDPNDPLRGFGPFQACGAAISVAVEAQEWAANFFSGGGTPSTLIKSAIELGEGPEGDAEADALREQWMSKPHNVPRVIDPTIESVEAFGINPEAAQLNQSRLENVGEVARMTGIPGPLLEYSAPGSSLTYQNQESIWTDFLMSCLAPNYLEPIEQAFSDLLVRSMIVRFNVRELNRPDMKTRFEVYGIAVDKGIMAPEEARQMEGWEPGDVETRPVPDASPAAVPAELPIQGRSEEVRCSSCQKLLAELATAPYRLACPRCKNVTAAAGIAERSDMQPQTNVTIAEGAIQLRVDAPAAPNITVQSAPAPNVTIAEGAVSVHVDAPAAPNITIEAAQPANVTIAEGAVAVTVEAAPAPNVTIAEGAIRVDAPPPAQITVEAPPPAQITIEAAPAPNVDVHFAAAVPAADPPRLRIVKTADGATVESG